MNWNAVTALSAGVSALVIVIAALLSLMQLREIKKTRQLDLALHLLDTISSPEARELRRFVYEIAHRLDQPLSSEDMLKVDQVLSGLDRMWLLAEEKQVKSRLIFDAYGPMIVRIWRLLAPVVAVERRRRGNWYRARAQELARQAGIYCEKHGLQVPDAYAPSHPG